MQSYTKLFFDVIKKANADGYVMYAHQASFPRNVKYVEIENWPIVFLKYVFFFLVATGFTVPSGQRDARISNCKY